MKKILITGSSGFIGSHLVDELIRQGKGKQIRLLIPPKDSLKNLKQHKRLDIVWGDIRDQDAVKKAMEGAVTIYHLAAKTVMEGTNYSEYADVNVNGTQNLLNSCRNRNIQKFVFFSSIAVYGLPAYVGEIINWNESRTKRPAESYGKSKLEAEKRVIKFHQQTGMPYAIVRPTTVYGPRDHQGILELYKAIQGHYFFQVGDGKNLMDYVFVRDIVKGVILAQRSKLTSGDYILGCGQPVTASIISHEIAESIHQSVPKISVPKDLAIAISYPVWVVGRLVGMRPLIFPKRVKILTTNCFFDISKARGEIGYNPSTTFDKGADITGKWLIRHKII